ncbi:aldehyde dehydrogenase EutE [bacterium (candidate division B38) B3_B38]|nr:MAG: aldehyde dehydrogenase EutE [bacterium (candidate division B38) B3_B38]
MELNESQIASIVERVAARLQDKPPEQAKETPELSPADGFFPTVDEAVEKACSAQHDLVKLPVEQRKEIIATVRRRLEERVDELSLLAVNETGMGRYEDKLKKNQLAIRKTPGVQILEPIAWSGDHGLSIMERAPYGVIGSITPSTNPSETIICNAIGMIAAGNAAVFNAHPAAREVSALTIKTINQAVAEAGGPSQLLTSVVEPTVETAQEIMKHEGIGLLVVTGGVGVVKVAMQSGKKVIAAGPGNPPVVVDDTADIDKAARDIVNGAALDNNIVCLVEKEVIALDCITDKLKQAMKRCRAMELSPNQLRRLEGLLVEEGPQHQGHGLPNKNFIGKDAGIILKETGVEADEGVRLLFAETDRDHPFVWVEMMMPVIPLVRVRDIDEAICLAKEVEQDFRHTAVMHSRNIDHLSRMARVADTAIFVKNGPSYAGLGLGGEGYTSFTIAGPTGEGLTSAIHFARERRCVLVDSFRIV